MAIKCSGAEFKRFYSDPEYWKQNPSGTGDETTWHDDQRFTVDGVEDPDFDSEKLSDTSLITIEGGMVFGPVVGADEPSLEAYFRRWRKAQTTAVLLVSCDKSLLDAMAQAITAAGGKIIQS